MIEKVYDIDPGDAQVLVPGAGWTFDISGDMVTTDSEGQVTIDLPTVDGWVSVDITEESPPADLGNEWRMSGASCEVTLDDGQIATAAVGDRRGTVDLEGAAIRDIVVNAGETVTCTFVNQSGAVEEATSTPRITPPPTAADPVSGTPGGDTWRIVLLALAGLLAMILAFIPATPARSRRRR